MRTLFDCTFFKLPSLHPLSRSSSRHWVELTKKEGEEGRRVMKMNESNEWANFTMFRFKFYLANIHFLLSKTVLFLTLFLWVELLFSFQLSLLSSNPRNLLSQGYCLQLLKYGFLPFSFFFQCKVRERMEGESETEKRVRQRGRKRGEGTKNKIDSLPIKWSAGLMKRKEKGRREKWKWWGKRAEG